MLMSLVKTRLKKAGTCKARAETPEVRSFKRYYREHSRKDIAGIPWSVIESSDQNNDLFQHGKFIC